MFVLNQGEKIYYIIIANEEVVRSAPTKRALSTDLDDDESVMAVLRVTKEKQES